MQKNADKKSDKQNLSGMFLSGRMTGQPGYEDLDYIIYDEYEEAEIVLIPIEADEESLKISKVFDFSFSKEIGIIDAVMSVCEQVGQFTVSVLVAAAITLWNMIKRPAVFMGKRLIVPFLKFIRTKIVHSVRKRIPKDTKELQKDIYKAVVRIKKASKMGFRSSVEELIKHLRMSFVKYRRIWVGAFNVAFPAVCILILFATLNNYSDMAFALKVNYNGQDIGYVENEDVYNRAKESAIKRLSTGAAGEEANVNPPKYEIELLALNKLSDSKTISEEIIKNTDGNYINACGIYIDGEFVCAVKSEADAINVFDQILEPHRKKADKNATVAFVEEITYVQSLYPDTEEIIWDAKKLQDKITSTKSDAVYYTVENGDTLSGIASKHGLYTSELLSFNPKVKSETIHVGDKLVVSTQVNYIRVKVMKTEKRKVDIAYETETKETNTLYKGTSKTVQKGQNGVERITEMVTYIDGVKTYATTLSTEIVKQPVTEIIHKGTKEVVQNSGGGYYGGGYGNYLPGNGNSSYTGGKLRWPTSGAYSISSYYGWRTLYGRSDFHGGVDIVRPGGNSAGLPVLAAAGGTVVSYTTYGSYGYSIVIDHGNGLRTRYAHMIPGSVSVRVGSRVSSGQQIGKIGRSGNVTGYHLHFEVIKNGARVNPLPYIR
ncbi:MAG: M23 family metallopeptidase [Ruminococcaceae bacterium]|nr:M23 family metallopeptidase [Oscillospiraceae bacterium]